MRPRFGVLTRGLALAFALAGFGAAFLALHTGHQTTPGHGSDPRLILFSLAAVFLAVAAGLWIEALWAWWTGLAIASATVALDLAMLHDGGWMPWLAILAAFGVTAVQGIKDRSQAPASTHPW
jgi:hypothetical protein